MCDNECIDVLDNDDNCGSCGNVCGVSANIGGCTAGECDPFWSSCYEQDDGFTTCDEICANEGKTCVAYGCDGYTSNQGNGAEFCTAKYLGAPTTEHPCDTSLIWQETQLLCCCQ
jgi:hypothetical protein